MDNELEKEFSKIEAPFFQALEKFENLEQNLGCIDGKIIGTGRSDYTIKSTEYNLFVGEKPFVLIDVPGIEGNEAKFEDEIRKSIDKAHLVFYVLTSGKKIETGTLEKIKKYMHDRTSVYAVFNVHCKAKANPIKGKDLPYKNSLRSAYSEQQEIVIQTEKYLRDFLGENFKGSISLNGLLAFCANAVSEGKTTIVVEDDKNLRHSQDVFARNYDSNFTEMKQDSKIAEIEQIVETKTQHFKKDILDENKKKLKNRLCELLEKIVLLKNNEEQKIEGHFSAYDDFIDNCLMARNDFIGKVDTIAYKAVSEVFEEKVKKELYAKIERLEGKIKEADLKDYFASQQFDISEKIRKNITKKIEKFSNEYKEDIKEANERLAKDFKRVGDRFELSFSRVSLGVSGMFKIPTYTLGDLAKHTFTIASSTAAFATGGAALGSFVPGLGNFVGAIIGGFFGLLFGLGSVIIGWSTSAQERINKQKRKLGQALDVAVNKISGEIQTEISNSGIRQKINESANLIVLNVNSQKVSLNSLKNILNSISQMLTDGIKTL